MNELATLTEKQIRLTQNSLDQHEEQFPEIIADLYPTFIARYPQYASYFEQTDFRDQRQNVFETFAMVIDSLGDPHSLESKFSKLARVHDTYDIPEKAFEDMGEVMIELLAKEFGETWDDELEHAWAKFWSCLSNRIK